MNTSLGRCVTLLALISFITAACMPALQDGSRSQPKAKTGTVDLTSPLSIVAKHFSGYGLEGSWRLGVQPDGSPELEYLWTLQERKPRRFQVEPGRIMKLRQAIVEEDFFTLPPEIGLLPVDGPSRVIRVTLGSTAKEVRINADGCEQFNSPKESARIEREIGRKLASRSETQRALFVWARVRRLFDDPNAIDSLPEDLDNKCP